MHDLETTRQQRRGYRHNSWLEKLAAVPTACEVATVASTVLSTTKQGAFDWRKQAFRPAHELTEDFAVMSRASTGLQ
jgi:hypothetical protein